MLSRLNVSFNPVSQKARTHSRPIADLNSHTLGTNEEVTKISILDLSVNDKLEKFIVVGTAIWEDGGSEPSKGRVLLFRAQMGRSRPAAANPALPTVSLALDTEITGSVVALGEVAGYLAIIVNTVVSSSLRAL